MASRGFVRPVGPLPAGVYWWRRGLLALALLAVILVGRAVLGGGDGKAASASAATAPRPKQAATAAPTPSKRAKPLPVASASDSPVPTGTPAAPPGKAAATTGSQPPAAAAGTPPACRASQVTLTAAADATSYAGDQEPRFSMAVANTGRRACRVDLGTAVRSLVVYSGSDRIWSSGDCQTAGAGASHGGGHTVVTLRPKQRIAYTATWSRHRSSPATCGAAPVSALPGTYRVSGHLGGVTSSDVAFVLR